MSPSLPSDLAEALNNLSLHQEQELAELILLHRRQCVGLVTRFTSSSDTNLPLTSRAPLAATSAPMLQSQPPILFNKQPITVGARVILCTSAKSGKEGNSAVVTQICRDNNTIGICLKKTKTSTTRLAENLIIVQ